MSDAHCARKASVRLALPSELPLVSHVLTRAFACDPAMNWFGSVKDMIPDHNSTSRSAVKTMERLNHFMTYLCKMTLMIGGIITIVVVHGEDKGTGTEDDPSTNEIIVAATLWLKPGQKVDSSVWNIVRSHPWKLLLGWRWNGLKRILFDFAPKVERALDKSFQSRPGDIKPIDSWHLLLIAVDPDHEGRGYCSLIMRDGFTRTSPYPVHLEATTAKSRDVYYHFKFEVDEELAFGKGQVDANGVAAKGQKATGYLEWVMTKWNY